MRIPTLIISAMLLCAPLLPAAEAEDTPDVLDMSLDANIATPEVPRKAKTYITTAMDQLRRHFVKNDMSAEMLREGEVIELTVPCSDLFGPGAVEPKKSALEVLRPLGLVVRDASKYKVLVAVHTDDTGDEQYADSIAEARANAIDDCLWTLAGEKETNVVPYGIGKDEPIAPNDNRANRERNRRVEIFIIPDRGLLEMAGVKRK